MGRDTQGHEDGNKVPPVAKMKMGLLCTSWKYRNGHETVQILIRRKTFEFAANNEIGWLVKGGREDTGWKSEDGLNRF